MPVQMLVGGVEIQMRLSGSGAVADGPYSFSSRFALVSTFSPGPIACAVPLMVHTSLKNSGEDCAKRSEVRDRPMRPARMRLIIRAIISQLDLSYNYAVLTVIGGIIVLLIWLVIVFARGGFWSVRTNLLRTCDSEHRPVRICVVVPARNEAETIGRTVTALLKQTFNGTLRLIIVDDDSEDQTARLAARAAETIGRRDALTVITGMPLPEGWTGKLWAVSQGL